MTISRTRAAELINDAGGRIFTATVTTQDGRSRMMNCRKGVSKGVKNKKPAANIALLGMIRVWDMQKKDYRTLNLPNITGLKINKASYTVR